MAAILSQVRNSPMMPERGGPEPVKGPVARPAPGMPRKPVRGTALGGSPGGVRTAVPPTFRRGGRVKRGGVAKVHKGERIVGAAGALGKGVKAKKRAKEAEKAIKKAKKAGK